MIKILFEDPDFLVVEKPKGIATQPLASRTGARPCAPTLAHLIAEQYPEIKSVGGPDWGAVHRLDRETSGLVLFARNQKTYDYFRQQFSHNKIVKEYTALVEGEVEKGGVINWPIGADPKSAKRVKVYKNLKEARRNKAQEAVTIYEPIHKNKLRLQIKTGRRHQIRAHLAAIGHPIVGDSVYTHAGARLIAPVQLHASRLKFRHPRTGQWVEISSVAEAPASIPSPLPS